MRSLFLSAKKKLSYYKSATSLKLATLSKLVAEENFCNFQLSGKMVQLTLFFSDDGDFLIIFSEYPSYIENYIRTDKEFFHTNRNKSLVLSFFRPAVK